MTFLRKEGAYWKIYYYLNGKKRKISTRTSSKTLAEQIKIKFINDLAANKFNLDLQHRITLKEFISEVNAYSKVNKASGTHSREKRIFNNFLEFIGDVYIDVIDSKRIEEYKKHLSGDYTPNGINIILRHLSAAFSLAVKYKHISINPFKQIKKIPVPQKQPVFLTQEQAADILKATEGRHIHQYIMIALYSGCRISEIANLLWSNVNDKTIKVTGKGDKERTIPIPDRLAEYLKTKPRSGPYVISGSRSVIVTSKQFRKYADRLKFYHFTFHNLRDTYASWLAQAGTPIQVIKELLGHASIQTTMIYAHLNAKTLQNAVKSLDFPKDGTDTGTNGENAPEAV